MKIDKLIVVSVFVFCLSSASELQSVTIKQAKCVLPPELFYQNFSCYAKSLNRTCSTLTMIFEAIIPMNKIYVSKLPIFYIDSWNFDFSGRSSFAIQVRDHLSRSHLRSTFWSVWNDKIWSHQLHHKVSLRDGRPVNARFYSSLSLPKSQRHKTDD